MERTLDLESRWPGFKSLLCHLPAAWLGQVANLSVSFPHVKIILLHQAICRIQWNNVWVAALGKWAYSTVQVFTISLEPAMFTFKSSEYMEFCLWIKESSLLFCPCVTLVPLTDWIHDNPGLWCGSTELHCFFVQVLRAEWDKSFPTFSSKKGDFFLGKESGLSISKLQHHDVIPLPSPIFCLWTWLIKKPFEEGSRSSDCGWAAEWTIFNSHSSLSLLSLRTFTGHCLLLSSWGTSWWWNAQVRVLGEH